MPKSVEQFDGLRRSRDRPTRLGSMESQAAWACSPKRLNGCVAPTQPKALRLPAAESQSRFDRYQGVFPGVSLQVFHEPIPIYPLGFLAHHSFG